MAKIPTQSVYNKLEKSTMQRLSRTVPKLVSGKFDIEAWQDAVIGILADKHAAAATLGRNRAGDAAARGNLDDVLGQVVATEEETYLHSFAQDVTGGRYTLEDGTLDGERIGKRLNLYSRKLLGTCNEAFVQASELGATFDWHLGAVEDHCKGSFACPDLAKNSPYTAQSIPTYPRAGATPCLFHCKCALVRHDGVTGFNPPDLQL